MAELPKRPKDKRNLAERLRPKPKQKPVSRTKDTDRTISERDIALIARALGISRGTVSPKGPLGHAKSKPPVAKSRLTKEGKKLVKDKKQTGGKIMKKKMMGGGKTSKNMAKKKMMYGGKTSKNKAKMMKGGMAKKKMMGGGKTSKYMAKGGKTSKYMSKMARGGKKTKYMSRGGRR